MRHETLTRVEGLLGTIGAALVALVGRLTVNSRPNRVRKTLADTLPLYNEAKDIPALRETADTLAAVLAAQARHLQELEQKAHSRTFDVTTLVVAFGFAAPFGYGAWWLWVEAGGWWRFLAVASGLLSFLLVWFGFDTFFKGPAEPRKKAEQQATPVRGQDRRPRR